VPRNVADSSKFTFRHLEVLFRYTEDGRGAIEQPVVTRWGSQLRTELSIDSRRSALEMAIDDPEFKCIAVTRKRQGEDDNREEDLRDDSLLPYPLQGRGVYTSVALSVKDMDYWDAVKEYQKLNAAICEAITMLSSGSALLSDAAISFLQLNDKLMSIKDDAFPRLLPTSADVAVFKQKWKERFQGHLTNAHYAALLLDPRKHVREFVKSQPAFLGEGDTFGNTAAIAAASAYVTAAADDDIPDDHPAVQSLSAKMTIKDAKEKLLDGQLRAYIGVHPKMTVKNLGIDDKLLRQCVEGDSPSLFFSQQVRNSHCELCVAMVHCRSLCHTCNADM
jgi:hypothetical protein